MRWPRLALLIPVLALSACHAESLLLSDSGVPPCAAPAPLEGRKDPRAPGYIVVYRSGTPVRTTTFRLAAQYGFRPRYIYEHALLGFAAELSGLAVAALRCEPVVQRISHDALVTIGE